jgi:Holliday junction DNA helicase RuvA
MISLLKGNLRSRIPYTIVIEAHGVGYEVLCTQEAYERAPQIGTEYELMTRLIVREDSMTLFGFTSAEERTLFDQILSVSGIGPKTAIGILSAIGPDDLREAIRSSDIRRLTGVPNVGKKTAERLIVELRDKLLKEETTEAVAGAASSAIVRADALQALLALGYQRVAAEKAIRNVLRDTPASATTTEALVKAALREVLK